jgi:hypothetical protein
MIKNKPEEEFKNIKLAIKEGILYCNYKEDKINLEKAKQIIIDRNNYMENCTFPAIIKSINKIEVDKQARAYFKTKESGKGLKAVAMISTNYYSRIIMNFMLKLYTPANMPIKMFIDEKKAIEWLQQYMK